MNGTAEIKCLSLSAEHEIAIKQAGNHTCYSFSGKINIQNFCHPKEK
jgi:hypothetical protein